MPLSQECLLVQYADDTTILAPADVPSSTPGVQSLLDQIDCWARTNCLSISFHKSAAMRVSNSRSTVPPAYYLSGSPIPSVQSLPILGVVFSSTLDFSPQIADTVSRARRTLGFVTRVSRNWGHETFRALYTALVLPRLEYCCSVWGPFQAHLIDRLEGVQRRATRTLHTRMLGRQVPVPPYEARLRALGWQSLCHRRTVARVGLLCRLLDGSMSDTHLHSCIRIGKRSGQPELLHARTVRHSHSVLPAALRDFLAAPLSIRSPLPNNRDESAALRRAFSRSKHLN
ncbi:uncharacterized protein LOC115311578 [Ixodes scapularis]|uniref:uncharacterized protein LOC115311578 n=1 Tax=Ixodes scapularis TaxID=6945 RepID=UPI001A9EA86B|nr:uncharacterized protein LOC115311578 [Ixodes scapularis]